MANGEYYTIESRVARLEQRTSDMDARILALTPLVTNVVQLNERVETFRRDLKDFIAASDRRIEESDRRAAEADERVEENRRERRIAQRAMWTLTVMILCALIGAATILLTSGVHPG